MSGVSYLPLRLKGNMPVGFRVHDLNNPVCWRMLMWGGLSSAFERWILAGVQYSKRFVKVMWRNIACIIYYITYWRCTLSIWIYRKLGIIHLIPSTHSSHNLLQRQTKRQNNTFQTSTLTLWSQHLLFFLISFFPFVNKHPNKHPFLNFRPGNTFLKSWHLVKEQ